ncbi:MAG TPA: SpoIVB peptidase S55 domain-containing protein [Polyangia bacterium]|jgi:hypothetical protein
MTKSIGVAALALAATLAAGSGRDALAQGRPAVGQSKAAAPLSRRNIIPVSEIKAGMEGYGLTAFEGIKPQKFHVKVIGVLRNMLPKQDVVLFTSDDARLKHTGIVAGMSGSPVYLGGRLAGAVSYGWAYSKDPVGGFTPIEYMLEVGDRPLRGRDRTALAQADSDQSRQLLAQTMGVTPEGRPAGPAKSAELPAVAGMQRVAVPLSLTGFAPRAVEELRKLFAPFGLDAVQAGGGGQEPGGPTKFEPGAAIAITLIRGDMSAVSTGTVTYVEGNRVLAFGHPMFQAGEIYLPVSTVRVFTHLASSYRSMKMGAPMAEAGSLVMDRQAAIAADTTTRTSMIPIEVTVSGQGLPARTMRAEIAKHKFLTPMLAGAVVMSAAQESAPDIAHAVVTVHSSVKVRGHEPLTFSDRVFTQDGLSPRVLAYSAGFRALNEVLFNPFEPAHIEKLSFRVEVAYRSDVAEMVGLRVDSLEVNPGQRVNLYVTMRPYNGAEYVETVPFDVPKENAGQTLSVELTPGSYARQPVPTPENLAGIIANLRKPPYPGDTFVISLMRQSDGVAYRGRLMPELPPSEIDTLRQSTSLRRVDSYRAVTHIVRNAGRVVVGRQGITFKVKDLP